MNLKRPRIVVFASGSAMGGGSGFEKLVLASQAGVLRANIVAVISNHQNGGVREKARRFQVPFVNFRAPWAEAGYQEIMQWFAPDLVALSGWLKKVEGLNPKTTINIHPAPLPEFGGPGMYGHHVHEAVLQAFKAGRITHSAVSMHFVTAEYDKGPVFFEMPVKLRQGYSAEDIGRIVNHVEHEWQPRITDLVVNGQISWDGKDPTSLKVPNVYGCLPQKTLCHPA